MVKTFRPASLSDALEIINDAPLYIFAGGTDLMVKKRRWAGIIPSFDKDVLFISNIKELSIIEENDESYIIGSGATCAEIGNSNILPDYIKDVFRNMASPGIRNLATIGGNIGNSSPAGDSLPLLYALNSDLVLVSKNNERVVPIINFITGPGKNIKDENEIIKEIIIPKVSFNKIMIKKVGTRSSTALAKLSFVGLAVKKNKIKDFRVSFGAVGPKIVRNIEAEKKAMEMINSGNFNEEDILKLYERYIIPIDDQRSTAKYRKVVSLSLLKEFIKALKEEK